MIFVKIENSWFLHLCEIHSVDQCTSAFLKACEGKPCIKCNAYCVKSGKSSRGLYPDKDLIHYKSGKGVILIEDL